MRSLSLLIALALLFPGQSVWAKKWKLRVGNLEIKTDSPAKNSLAALEAK